MLRLTPLDFCFKIVNNMPKPIHNNHNFQNIKH